MNWQDDKVELGLRAAQRAAMLADDIQSSLVKESLTKDDRSPVTVADFAAQAIVGAILEDQFPGAILVGEEQADVLRSPDQAQTLDLITGFVRQLIPGVSADEVCDLIDRGGQQPEDRYWTLDPIDGTKGFLRGAQYACALAYVEGGEVQLGVLGCPNLTPDLERVPGGRGSLLIGKRGQGSWISSLKDEIDPERFRRLAVSSGRSPADARVLRSFEKGHTNLSQIDLFQEAMGVEADPVSMDSQVKYALLASGEGEIYLRLLSSDRPDYREKIWDQAAGSILVQEAGGTVTDLEGKELDFSRGRTLAGNRGVCATNGELHPPVLDALGSIKA